MFKAMTMYMTAPLAYQRMVSEGVRMAYYGVKGGQWGTARRGVKAAVIGHVILPTLFQFAAQGFELDDDEDKHDLLRAAIIGNINNYFALGDALETIVNWTTGKKFGYTASPMESFVPKTGYAIMDLIDIASKYIEGEGLSLEDVAEFLKSASTPIAYGTGVPLIGMSNMAKGVIDASRDEEATLAKKIKWGIGYSKEQLDKSEYDKEGKSKGGGIYKPPK